MKDWKIGEDTGYRNISEYAEEINKTIKKRESSGWRLVNIKGFLTRTYNERSESEYILVFEKQNQNDK
ncbi:MAG: hypothetical protein ACRCYT_06400 [Cetobacterium sp.]